MGANLKLDYAFPDVRALLGYKVIRRVSLLNDIEIKTIGSCTSYRPHGYLSKVTTFPVTENFSKPLLLSIFRYIYYSKARSMRRVVSK